MEDENRQTMLNGEPYEPEKETDQGVSKENLNETKPDVLETSVSQNSMASNAPKYDYQNYQNTSNMQPQQAGKGFSIASMVLGIITIVFGCCLGYFVFIPAVVSIVLGIISLKDGKPGKGMAIAGIVCSVVGVVIVLALIIIGNIVLNDPQFQKILQEAEEAAGK